MSQNPQSDTPSSAAGQGSAPSTPASKMTLKDRMRAAAASGAGEYSPSSTTSSPAAPAIEPGSPMQQQLHHTQVNSPQAYTQPYYPNYQQPVYYLPQYPGYPPNMMPFPGNVRPYGHVPMAVPGPGAAANPNAMYATGAHPNPAIGRVPAAAPAATNAHEGDKAPSAAPAQGTTPIVTVESTPSAPVVPTTTVSPAAATTTATATPPSQTPNSTVNSFMIQNNAKATSAASPATSAPATEHMTVPEGRAALTSSGEPTLQLPVRPKNPKTTAASATTTPAATAVASPAASTVSPVSVAATDKPSTSPATTGAPAAAEQAKATASPVPTPEKKETFAQAAARSKANDAAKAADSASASTPSKAEPKTETPKTEPAKTPEVEAPKTTAKTETAKPAASAPAETKPSLKESFEVNFEVDDSVKKPAKPTAAAVVANAAAKTTTDSTKPTVEAKSPVAKVAANGHVEASSAPVSTPTKSPSPAPVISTPTASALAYKITAEDQKTAKQNDTAAGLPPGLLMYTPEYLMSFAKFAKDMPAPMSLQKALDRTSINSPGGRAAGKGGGGKGGRRADKANKPPPTPVRPVGIEPGSIEAKSRTFRGILNKITPETFDKLTEKMIAVPVENHETLAALVDIIVDVSVRELKFCAMYASLCANMAAKLPEFSVSLEDGATVKATFRTIILTKCQTLFQNRRSVQPAPEDLTDPEKRQEWEIKENKVRGAMLGLVKFLGELANQSVLAMMIIPHILNTLWEAKLGYDDLELYTILLSTSGKKFESKNFVQQCRDWVSEYAKRDKEQQDSEGTRIRYLLQDTIDLADNNWVPRSASSAAQGPKTLDEIREDIARRERILENELRNAKKGPGGVGKNLAQPVPTKAGGRGPAPFSVMQRDQAPRTPSSPSQGGRGKPGFASQAGGTPARGSGAGSSSGATPASSGLASPTNLSNAFDSLSLETGSFDPNFLTASTSSAPADDETETEEMNTSQLDESIEEFLDSNVADEVVEMLADGPALEDSCKYFISRLLLKVLDMTTDKKLHWAIDLLVLFTKPEYNLNDPDRLVVPALIETVSQLENIDLPRAPHYMGVILFECLKRKIITPGSVNKILVPLQGAESQMRATQVIVTILTSFPPAELAGFIKQSNFNIANWKIPEDKVPAAMKQQLETAESQIARGEDPLKVAIWAQANSPNTLKNPEFVTKVVKKIIDDAKEAASTKAPLDGLSEVIKLIVSNANANLQNTIARVLVEAFTAKPSAGLPLFTLFVDNGFKKPQIIDAAERLSDASRNDRYMLDPSFNTWCHQGAAASASSSKSSGGSKSSGKGGKGGKKKGK